MASSFSQLTGRHPKSKNKNRWKFGFAANLIRSGNSWLISAGEGLATRLAFSFQK